jgi:hypothetical protein
MGLHKPKKAEPKPRRGAGRIETMATDGLAQPIENPKRSSRYRR